MPCRYADDALMMLMSCFAIRCYATLTMPACCHFRCRYTPLSTPRRFRCCLLPFAATMLLMRRHAASAAVDAADTARCRCLMAASMLFSSPMLTLMMPLFHTSRADAEFRRRRRCRQDAAAVIMRTAPRAHAPPAATPRHYACRHAYASTSITAFATPCRSPLPSAMRCLRHAVCLRH